MLPLDIEGVARVKREAWDKEVQHRHLLKQIPRQPTWWQRFTGFALIRFGTWLAQCGKRMARQESHETVSVTS
jgi:hypothetical protein